MKRRDLCIRAGGIVTASGLAIYAASSASSRAENRRSTGETMDDDSQTSDDTTEQDERDGPFDRETVDRDERYEIGDSDDPDLQEGIEPHLLYVVNDAGEEREIAIRIDRDSETVFERTESIPSASYVEFVLVEPAVYETNIETDGSKSTSSVDRSWSDCARSRTVVTISASGINTRTRTVQTSCD